MADQPTYKFLPEDKCLSESQLFDYIDGRLKTSDMHLVEKHILACGFCSDALEGLEKVKHRDKVAAFIPAVPGEQKKDEPKVIPLNPNRKYYALAAGIVLILGIVMFMKLSVSGDKNEAKMAQLTQADSSAAVPHEEKTALTFKNTDSIAKEPKATAGTVRNENSLAQLSEKSAEKPATFSRAYPEMEGIQQEQAAEADRNMDGEDMDDFVNVVDAKPSNAEAKKDMLKEEASDKQEVAVAEKNKFRLKDQVNKKSPDAVAAKENVAADVPVTNGPVSQGAAAPPSTTTVTGTATPTYVWSTAPSGGVTDVSTGSYTTIVLDTTIVTTKNNRELDLSYENANKMLASGQAAASLALYDEVLKNPAHAHYQDAQWKKAEALIQLKRIDEAKKLLNEIAAKTGKYQAQAKEKLKTL